MRESRGGWIHVYVRLSPLLFTWNYRNIINQLYPNTKLKVKKQKTPHSHCRGLRFDPWSRKTLHAMWHSQKYKINTWFIVTVTLLLHTLFYCALLCWFVVFTNTDFFFTNWRKICGKLVASKPISDIFTTAFVHFLSLCHILAILAVFQAFSSLLYLLWGSVISDLLMLLLWLDEGSEDVGIF